MVHDALISPFPRYRNLRSLKKDPFAMALFSAETGADQMTRIKHHFLRVVLFAACTFCIRLCVEMLL